MSAEEQALLGIDKLNVLLSEVPVVTHVDYSARIQTVDKETNPRYHALIARFEQLTGYLVLVNTSFNVRGEPIVCSPEDGLVCFMGTGIESHAIGNCVLHKDQQDPALARETNTLSSWTSSFSARHRTLANRISGACRSM
jgi:carbamoyltransferase